MSLVLRLPHEMHLSRSSSNVPRPPSLLKLLQNHHVLITFDKVHDPLRLPCETTSERPQVLRTGRFCKLLTWKCAWRHNGVHFFDIATSKSVPTLVFFYVLTSKCASRHNGVLFFDISTFKSAPKLRCLVHFDFEICFAPQRRAFFHLSSSQDGSASAALASLLFGPPEPHIIGKTQCFATFLPFRAPGSSFF